MFIVGGVAIVLSSLLNDDPPIPAWITTLWGIALAVTGLVPPTPPLRVNRIAACICVAISVAAMTMQAQAIGEGVASAEAAFVILFPLMFMVVVPDDPWVTGFAGASAIVGVVFFIAPSNPDIATARVQGMITTTVLVALVALAGTLFHGYERKQELALEQERSAKLEDLAVRERLVNQAERAAQIGRMVADVGHEINNPLTYVVASLELLQEHMNTEELDDPERLEALNDALDGTRRIEQIVRDLKTAARNQDDDGKGSDPNEAIRAALRMSTNELRQRTRVESELGEVPWIPISEGRFTQIIVNLLINAAHAIPEGDHRANLVRVSTCTTLEGNVRIEVRDTGTGMSASTLERVFEPFYTTKKSGTGLGLPICKKFVEASGGSLTLESTVGTGTTIQIDLPPVLDPRQSEDRPDADGGDAPARILVIDDERLIGVAITRMLGKSHEVIAMESATDALALLSRPDHGAFDIILCDLMMPDLSGMELFERVQADAPEVAERMIFMTGGAFTDAATQFIESVPNEVIDKPVRRVTLERLVAERAPSAKAQ